MEVVAAILDLHALQELKPGVPPLAAAEGPAQSTDCRSARAKEVSEDCRFEFAYNAALQAATTALAAHSRPHWTFSSNCFRIHVIAYRVANPR